jgi:hypothetical protein
MRAWLNAAGPRGYGMAGGSGCGPVSLAFPVIRKPVCSNGSDTSAAKRSNSRLVVVFLAHSIGIS